MKIAIRALVCAMLLVSNGVFAEYPEKPVNFIVPWPPGDLEDILTRMIAEDFQKTYNIPTAVLNKHGGVGPFVGAINVAEAPADGYTIGSFVTAVPVLGHDVGVEALAPEKFEPLGIFLTYPFVLAAAKDAPYSNPEQLSAYAAEHDVVLGHSGEALVPTQVIMAFARNMGFEWGGEKAFDSLDCNTLVSGDADVINTTLQSIMPCIDDVKLLASITESRLPNIPDTPTVGEYDSSLGLSLWNGLFVRKETPADIRQKIVDVAKQTVKSSRAQKLAQETGALVYWLDDKAAAQRIVVDRGTLGEIAKILLD